MQVKEYMPLQYSDIDEQHNMHQGYMSWDGQQEFQVFLEEMIWFVGFILLFTRLMDVIPLL